MPVIEYGNSATINTPKTSDSNLDLACWAGGGKRGYWGRLQQSNYSGHGELQ